MATGTVPEDRVVAPSRGELVLALVFSLVVVALTRWPVARMGPLETDDFGYLQTIQTYTLPPHHTLFLAAGRAIGQAVGDPYRGFVVLDMLTSALALVSVWWWLRALVRPATALAATALLAAAPVFWSYGALAGNYTAIPLVGCFLLGVAVREPRPWHPYASAALLALGTGYRQDIGTCWLPVFAVILWRHRWWPAIGALTLFSALNLAWLGAMLYDVGGWASYRAASAEFAYHAGYLNSFWNLGVIDAPLRYAVKAGMALVWTLGPGLIIAPRGLARLVRDGRIGLAGLLALSVAPALGFHLLVHFGVAGYAMHYIPALLALVALGVGRLPDFARQQGDQAPARLAVLAGGLAALFLLYPTNYDHPGLRGDFDLSFARHTRIGLRTPPAQRAPTAWRTVNSEPLPGVVKPDHRRQSVAEIWSR